MKNYYLFRSSRMTYNECIERMLVGQKEGNAREVLEVVPGDIIFIHKTGRFLPTAEQFIEGPYFATTKGQKDIVPDAWNGDFPYQVRIEKKGNIARISQNTFKNYSLRYSVDDKFMPFKLPDFIGQKLIYEFGVETKVEENK